MKKPIYLLYPYLPPLDDSSRICARYDNKVLTNCGPFHHQLEKALCQYLVVEHIALFTTA